MSLGKTFKLNTGATIPAVGLGTWQSKPNEVRDAVEWALRAGYRHIDCAAIYNNENEVGEGIKASGVPRSEIFITSKLWNHAHDPEFVEAALDKTLKDLGVEYLDLYLIHWPVAFAPGDNQFPHDADTGYFSLSPVSSVTTWHAMERLLPTGKVRAIGVSNFNQPRLQELLDNSSVVPAVNQIEAHPWLQQQSFLDWQREKGIHVTAYSPLGNNMYGKARVLDDAAIQEIARELERTAAQVLIAWAVRRGTSVVPKSVTKERIESNFDQFELPDEAFKKLNALERGLRYNNPINWGVDIFQQHTEEEIQRAKDEWVAKNWKK